MRTRGMGNYFCVASWNDFVCLNLATCTENHTFGAKYTIKYTLKLHFVHQQEIVFFSPKFGPILINMQCRSAYI